MNVMKSRPWLAGAIAAAVVAACTACGGGGGTSTTPAVSTASTGTTSSGATASPSVTTVSATAYTCATALTSGGMLDCTALPLGDRKTSSTPKAGYIEDCSTPSGSPVVSSAPWLNAGTNTWNALSKLVVEGSVKWPGTFTDTISATTSTIVSNGLPIASIPTGTFPISSSDPAYQYDRNPNSIAAQSDDFVLTANPSPAASPSCLGGGAIGITVTGVAIFDAFDGAGYDAVAREIQDGCHGHPDQSDTYHYHGWLQACVPDAGSATQNSSLLGYAFDGYGIYGAWYNGKILTTADLDACHGTTSPVMWNGKLVSMYHYVSTYDFPYTLGCYMGTPVRTGGA